jgi:hypothetical protein
VSEGTMQYVFAIFSCYLICDSDNQANFILCFCCSY